jgi:hypothetical protein
MFSVGEGKKKYVFILVAKIYNFLSVLAMKKCKTKPILKLNIHTGFSGH